MDLLSELALPIPNESFGQVDPYAWWNYMLEKRLDVGDPSEKRSFVSFVLTLTLCLTVLVGGMILDDTSGMDPVVVLSICLPLIGITCYIQLMHLRKHLKFAHSAIVWSEEGIRVEEKGLTLWQLEWEKYRGFRPISAHRWELIADPLFNGLELLTTDGSVVGFVPGFLRGSSASSRLRSELWRTLLQELRRRSADSNHNASLVGKPKQERQIGLALFGLVLLIPSLWATTNVLDIWRGNSSDLPSLVWLAEGYRIDLVLIPLTLGAVIFLFPVGRALLHSAIARAYQNALEESSLPSPNLDDLRLKIALSGGFAELERGKTYGYVHPEWTRRSLRTTIVSVWIFGALFGAMGAALIVAMFFDDQLPWEAAIFVSSLCLVIAVAAAKYAANHALLLRNLDHTIRVGDDQIMVVDKDGTRSVFSPKGLKAFHFPKRGSFEILRVGDGKNKYSIAPSHLMEIESE
jgi:hypothetical protein